MNYNILGPSGPETSKTISRLGPPRAGAVARWGGRPISETGRVFPIPFRKFTAPALKLRLPALPGCRPGTTLLTRVVGRLALLEPLGLSAVGPGSALAAEGGSGLALDFR